MNSQLKKFEQMDLPDDPAKIAFLAAVVTLALGWLIARPISWFIGAAAVCVAVEMLLNYRIASKMDKGEKIDSQGIFGFGTDNDFIGAIAAGVIFFAASLYFSFWILAALAAGMATALAIEVEKSRRELAKPPRRRCL